MHYFVPAWCSVASESLSLKTAQPRPAPLAAAAMRAPGREPPKRTHVTVGCCPDSVLDAREMPVQSDYVQNPCFLRLTGYQLRHLTIRQRSRLNMCSPACV